MQQQKYSWGGYRPGSGRRPKGDVSGVSHHTRAEISSRNPVCITLRTKPELGNLRRKKLHDAVCGALIEGCDTGTFRICQYSVQKNGILLLAEAKDRVSLSRGMQGVNVRIAKALNRLWDRNGSVFADRYETQVLKSGQQVRAALVYILNNFRLESKSDKNSVDQFSSATYFDGWDNPPSKMAEKLDPAPVVAPRTALLKTSWRKYGLLKVEEVPKKNDNKKSSTSRTS